MLLATINSSIILIALVIFRRIHLEPLRPANTNYLLRTTACLLVGWASVLSPGLTGSCNTPVKQQICGGLVSLLTRALLPPPFCTIWSRELRDTGRLRKRLRRTEWGRWLLARLRNCICTASI
jgi:hypothetical protein